jgi:hypothetical protein
MKEKLTDQQIDTEIARLNASPYVQLARKERNIRMRRRKYYYDLKWLENRGQQLANLGFTMESLELLDVGEAEDEE